MANHEEKQIVEELDREVARKGGLIALVACLSVGMALVATVLVDLLRVG